MNAKNDPPAPKAPSSHLHSLNLIVAMLAGIISITGGIYSLKSNLFSGPAYGSLQGIVRDEKIAKPLVLASVEVSGIDGAVVNTIETDRDGFYQVEKLKIGNYIVKFTAPLHKVESKNIKIEKDLASTINVDLVPEMQSSMPTASQEVAAAQTIAQPYTPTPTYPVATPAASSYNAAGTMSAGTNAPVAYAPANTASSSMQDEPYQGPPPGYRRRPHRYPGSYSATDSSDSSSSSGSSLATVGTQLLSAFIASKSNSSGSTNTSTSSN